MKVVVVGGGFGGVKAALKLANKKGVEVKLVSDKIYFEYHAALYRSATGRSPLEVVIPLRDFFEYAHNVEIVEDKITDIKADGSYVIGEDGSRYDYDRLVLATGNITEYYGIKGLAKYSYGVKTIHEALRLKRHLHEQLLSQEPEHNYVVVGAGATGVELSAELVAYIKKVRRRHKIKYSFKVDLIEASSGPLAAMPGAFSAMVTKRLKQLGVKTMLKTAVTSETANEIRLPKNSIRSRTVVWTAGITNNPLLTKHEKLFKIGKMGRVEVDQYLQATPNIYAIGDNASTPYSGMAQTAIYDADFVAKNIIRLSKNREQRSYIPKKPVYAIPVGSRWAAVLWGGISVYGWFGWALRRIADLKLYLTFLPPRKALTAWYYGSVVDEAICPVCGKL